MPIMPMPAGDLITPMDLQVKVQVRDAQGGFALAWAFMRTILTGVAPLDDPTRGLRYRRIETGKEFAFSGQQRAEVKHLIRCRYQGIDIIPDMRLVESATYVYNITEAVDVQRVKMEVRIFAVQNVSNADDPTYAWVCVTDASGNFVVDANGSYVVVPA